MVQYIWHIKLMVIWWCFVFEVLSGVLWSLSIVREYSLYNFNDFPLNQPYCQFRMVYTGEQALQVNLRRLFYVFSNLKVERSIDCGLIWISEHQLVSLHILLHFFFSVEGALQNHYWNLLKLLKFQGYFSILFPFLLSHLFLCRYSVFVQGSSLCLPLSLCMWLHLTFYTLIQRLKVFVQWANV